MEVSKIDIQILLLSLDAHSRCRRSIKLLFRGVPESVRLDVLHILHTILTINTITVTNANTMKMPQELPNMKLVGI